MADFPPMTDKAAEAFADYASMKPGKRSLRGLAETYVQQDRYKTASTAFRQLSRWSGQYQWPDRIASVTTAAANRKLELSAELDADTHFETARRFNDLIHSPGFIDANTLARIRESVRKPEPKGGTSVSVNLDIQISQAIERIADAEGMTDAEREEFERDVKMHLEKVRA